MKQRISSTLTVFAVMGILALAGQCSIAPAYAHDDVVKLCFAPSKPVKMTREDVLENGMLSEMYDRNGDGKGDVQVISTVYNIAKDAQGTVTYEHSNGLLYVVDQNFDGEPDIVFIDAQGTGKCSDLRFYQNLRHNPGQADMGEVKS